MRRSVLVFALSLAATLAHGAEQTRTAAPFSAISVEGAISVSVQAGAVQSLRVRGDEQFVNKLISEVVNGELRLHMPEKTTNSSTTDRRVIITLPALRAITVEGAGEIKLDNIRGERLDVRYKGAGRMQLQGTVNTLHLSAAGVGEVDAKALIAQRAEVQFFGIGEVQVYAKQQLDAQVRGMGTLRYFGRPRTVNKSVAGLGSVSAGE